MLDPDVVRRADMGNGTIVELRGAERVARSALAAAAQDGLTARFAMVNGALGWVSARDGKAYAVAAFGVRNGRITTIDIVLDPARLARLDLTGFDATFSSPG